MENKSFRETFDEALEQFGKAKVIYDTAKSVSKRASDRVKFVKELYNTTQDMYTTSDIDIFIATAEFTLDAEKRAKAKMDEAWYIVEKAAKELFGR